MGSEKGDKTGECLRDETKQEEEKQEDETIKFQGGTSRYYRNHVDC